MWGVGFRVYKGFRVAVEGLGCCRGPPRHLAAVCFGVSKSLGFRVQGLGFHGPLVWSVYKGRSTCCLLVRE